MGYSILDIDEQFSSLDTEGITSIINQNRDKAKLGTVQVQDVHTELGKKREEIRQLITEKLSSLNQDSYVELVTMLAEKCIADDDYNDGVILSDVIDQYEVRMQSALEESTDEIEKHIERIKSLANDEAVSSNIDSLIRRVEKWDVLPSQVTAHVNRKVWWRCSKGHEWNTLISTRSYGSKCPYCSGIITLKGFNDFATLHPDLAAEWSDRNGDLKPDAINERSTKNVWWKCSVCGNEWKSVVKSRVRGRVCPVCADREVLAGYNDLATTDPELLGEWDYEMNKDVEPTSISRNSMRPVWWKCKEGHSWKDKISNRTIEGRGCAACEAEFRRVLPQLLIMLYCGRNGLKPRINDEDTIGVPLDAYIPDLKLAFLAIGRGTKTETDTQAIAKHLCERRGIVLEAVSYRASSESLCMDIKRAFQETHVYFTSDFEEDIEIAHTQFYRWRRR